MDEMSQSRDDVMSTDDKIEEVIEVVEELHKLAKKEAEEIISSAKKEAEELIQSAAAQSKENVQKDSSNSSSDRINPSHVFKVILQRERTRSDRNGHELAFIIFEVHNETTEDITREVIKALKTRARTIDQFGWYEEGYIGIVLPNTSYDGGLKFARDVNEILLDNKTCPTMFKVYSYPSKWNMRNDFISQKTIESKAFDHQFIDGIEQVFTVQIPGWKRFIDATGALIALILFSPIFVIVPLLIKLLSKGPVFFTQKRVGYGGRVFNFIKFRTMKINGNKSQHEDYYSSLIKSDKPMIKIDKHDPRIIPFGKVLRKTCVDELPQLFCVLRGNMSLVGPRPCLPNEAKEYLKWHKYRFDIKPGMTGLWQVSGKDILSFQEMIRLDILYSKKLGFFKDIRILVNTIPAVVRIIIGKFKKDYLLNKAVQRKLPRQQFNEFIKRYYPDIYHVDKLEYLNDKLEKHEVDPYQIMLLLSKMNRLSPSYNVAKRYFGITRLIDFENKSHTTKTR